MRVRARSGCRLFAGLPERGRAPEKSRSAGWIRPPPALIQRWPKSFASIESAEPYVPMYLIVELAPTGGHRRRRGRQHPGLATAEWSGTVRNTMEIDGYKAVIQFDPDIDMFRGEFIGLNGGADFYARDIAGLRKEGAASLKVFLEMCEEDGVEPRRWYSGKFNLRISPELHESASAAAAAS